MAGKKKFKQLAEINVVPYIDVMLVLLIIFMVTAPLLMQGVRVDLPQAPSTPLENKDEEPIIVSIKQDGSYYLNIGGEPERERPLPEIIDAVAKILRQKPDTPVLVWGDTKVEYGIVVSVMSDLQGAGAPSVGLVTDPPREL